MASLIFILLNYFIPQPYIDRISGIKEGATEGAEGQDLSLISRLEAWRIAIEMIKDKPFVGVGFYRSGEVSDQYPDPEGGWRYSNLAIHNTFLKVAAETGLPALALYLYIFCSAYRTLTKIKARVRRAGMDKTIIGYATMLQVAFVGFFSSGFFVNASFLDISWHLVALSIALENIANKEMDKFMVANER
jgi:O-antigen ligase